MKETHYSGKSNVDIKSYLKYMYRNGAVDPSFIGHKPFKQLWDLGVVTPIITSIRLYIPAREDEHYIIMDENHVEGVSLQKHSGQRGLHNIEELLTKTEANYWEIHGLNPKAFRD